jgi:hypothetical protein
MANRYWVGGTATWDGAAISKWAEISGGAGGFSVPTASDDVFFDGSSGAGTVTIGTSRVAKSINCTGFTGTLGASGNAITVSGSVTLVSGMTYTHTGTMTINGTATLTTAGKSFSGLTINGSGITVTLGDALNVDTRVITVTQGAFDTANYNVTAGSISSSNTNTRTVTFGSSTVTLSATTPIVFTDPTNLTFNSNTSQINCTNANAVLAGGGRVFYNVAFTSTTAGSDSITGANTFNNLSVTAPSTAGVTQLAIGAPQTINGTLSTTGTAGNRRVWFRGATYGIAQTLTVNATPSLTDADFRDIYVVGTAAPISGTRIGNRGYSRGITFSTPKNVYWNLAGAQNWSANGWAPGSGGTPNTDNFPLPQDTAIFDEAGSVTGTITLDAALQFTGSVDMSARTTAMTLSFNSVTTCYGSWTNGSGVTFSLVAALTFSGEGTKIITSAGKTFSCPITVDAYAGTVELADALDISSNTLTVTNGTFDTKNYNVTANVLSSSNTNVRTITLGSSTVTLSNTLTFTTSTNLTFNSGTSSIIFSSSSAISPEFGGLIFYDVSFTNASVQTVTSGSTSNTFNNFSITAPASAGKRDLRFDFDQTINGTLTVAGASAVRRIFVCSNISGTTRTLTVGTLVADDCDFREITIAGTAAGSSPTRAGDCGSNSGITFPAPKTVYWNLSGAQNWSATAWAPSSGGSPDINNFPLAQDTAVFDEAGSVTGTITLSMFNTGTVDMSARTSAMTLSLINSPAIYGDWIAGTGLSVTGELNFSKRGTSTITSNGVTFDCTIAINCATGTVQLADALVLGSSRLFGLNSGTFDAVTYNVTVGRFNSGSATTLKMGSGLWTISGTGSVFTNASSNFQKQTADILLSDTSTSARTFDGGSLSYNKLTIGGATGTSTLTISGNNQFTELASTKTVAHTIALGTTTQTFGKWTVTGTSGNVVTLTGTGTSHVLAGSCTSGIDYLAMGSIGFAATSPGEFYAGANSTGTAAAPVYRTAKPADSTRYWVGGTGNWSDTNRWSTGSGGGGGASVPRSHDDVVFDSSSNATGYTATVNAVTGGIRCKALTIAGPASGNLTLAGSVAIFIHDDVTLPATGLTRTYSGDITLTSNGTGRTFVSNGLTLASAITINGVDCEWTLGDALSTGATATLTITNGLIDFDTYNVTAGIISSSNSNKRTIDFGSSTVTLSSSAGVDFGTTTNAANDLTVVSGTSQINFSHPSPTISVNGKTFYNVAFTSTSTGTVTINGANTFNNLSFTGLTSAGLKNISISANQTINGTLTCSAGTNATMRHFVQSNTIGTTRTLTCNAVSLTDVDFRDITIAGTAAPAGGTRIGDCKGNSGITFTAATTRYWNLAGNNNWSATGWAASSGASPDVNNFPLAQDTCEFESTSPGSGATITINAAYNIGTIDMSDRTSNTMTLTASQSPNIYGNWINGTGITFTGVGRMTFSGRGSQTITSAGRTFTQSFTIDSPGGSITLQDAFITNVSTSGAITFTQGTFDANGFNVTISGAAGTFSSTNSNTRTLAVGSGTWTIAGSGGSVWTTATSTNLTVTGTGVIKLTSGSAKTFAGGGAAYTNITLDQGGVGALTISGNNTFKDIINTSGVATSILLANTTQRVAQWTGTGTSGNVLTITGTSAASPATLILTGATDPNVDYLTITGIRAYDLEDTWYAGANSTNNGSLGWYFEAAPTPPPPPAGGTGAMFLLFM